MRKTIVFVLSFTTLAVANIACDKQKTVQEYLREERKAIERYIDRQGIEITATYPKGAFKANEYFKTNEGLYIHVVDSGNGRRVKPLVDRIQVRFDYLYYIKTYVSGKTDSTVLPFYYFPQEFIYGQSGSYGKNSYDFSCEGWAIPLAYMGEGAIVDLIIPSALGTSYDNSYPNFNAVFYKNLTYTEFW
ncbi:MAG: DUF4827 domain-containing protein [Candidatus Azobacteroides sp.]|nr:DUF4827 domain-containing protein [Candidatus Azobacteroides sp.]